MGDLVNTALGKMEAINERIKRGNASALSDAKEINELMDFLLKVQKLKNGGSGSM